jgi:AraC-like DNA-binding protein
VRLQQARRDLESADPSSGVIVAQVAARWGFADPGLFAGAYGSHFGVAPDDTLQAS